MNFSGFDTPYLAQRDRDRRELESTLAGPKIPLQPLSGFDIKNPENEYSQPASASALAENRNTCCDASRPSTKSSGGRVDPEGQQGGTHGGSPANPPLPNEIHPVASPEERRRESVIPRRPPYT